MSKSYSIVITSFSKKKTGAKLIETLLAAKLAACIQVFPIRSFYTWKGRTSKGRESLMLIKAKSRDFEAIKAVIVRNHDYDVPEIVSVPIARALAGYLAWIDSVTR